MSSTSEFEFLFSKFHLCHTDRFNILAHFITTPLGFIGLLSLFMKTSFLSYSIINSIVLIYLVSLLNKINMEVWLLTALLLSMISVALRRIKLKWNTSLALLVIGYMGQVLAACYVLYRKLNVVITGSCPLGYKRKYFPEHLQPRRTFRFNQCV